jgi:anti-sigma factor RsiW
MRGAISNAISTVKSRTGSRIDTMAEIITLRGSPHERVQLLLPWYAKATLSEQETAEVDLHLGQCAECRAELAEERALAGAIAALPLETERGWAAVAQRLDEKPRRAPGASSLAFFRRRIPAGWAGGAALAAASITVALMTTVPPRMPVERTYTAMGSPRENAPGNAVVMFSPDTSERQLRGLVAGAGARIVDGPTAAGGYVLRVAPRDRDSALLGLRRSSQVLLAQPIDAGRSP